MSDFLYTSQQTVGAVDDDQAREVTKHECHYVITTLLQFLSNKTQNGSADNFLDLNSPLFMKLSLITRTVTDYLYSSTVQY